MLVTLVTYKNFPEGCINNPCGFSPPVNGEPGMEVRAPVPMLMLNTEMSNDPLLATYRNLLAGSTASVMGPEPATNGEPATAVSAPVLGLTVKAETLAVELFAT